MSNVSEGLDYELLLRIKLREPLFIAVCITISIGAIFSIICLVKYFKDSNLRTHYSYIFYFMLFYCLMSSVLRAPIFLVGNYLNVFSYSTNLCRASVIHFLTINLGMVTSLAYASVERNFLIFHSNGVLTWHRQLLPVTCILVYSYCVGILFALIPSCNYRQCIACYTRSLLDMILWLTISFLIPQLVMIIATVCLLYRLYQQRAVLNRRPQWSALKRIGIQMSVYVIWSCLCYCPLSFYTIIIIIQPFHFEPDTKILIDIANIMVLQTYPILTFISMLLFTRRLQAQQRGQSTLKLNNVATMMVHSSDAAS